MYIKVRAKTGQRKEEIITESADHFVISVKEKAERNMANKRILEIVRSLFPGKSVRIINGHQSPGKLIAVDSPSHKASEDK
ncbi:MAG: DUF167 domain-containing protein [Candidatus Pacebacteria bacterium]|nr:DUF167 domain-containing protein [Candidatus Paceibacterota bacterium]